MVVNVFWYDVNGLSWYDVILVCKLKWYGRVKYVWYVGIIIQINVDGVNVVLIYDVIVLLNDDVLKYVDVVKNGNVWFDGFG